MRSDCIWGPLLLSSLSLGWTKTQETNYTRPVFYCGGDSFGSTGLIGSEGFPSFYKPNTKCTWHITVPEGNVVSLSFHIFDSEADSQCRYDYSDIYNGGSNSVQKLGRFCGTFRPGTQISTTNTMTSEMVSDGESHGRGFLAYFSGTKPYVNDEQSCGGKMTKAQGEIKTPNWPDRKYPPGTTCTWLITVEPDKVIQSKFEKFVSEADTYCRFDYVAFFNGGEGDDSRSIGKYCGDQTPQPIITSGNESSVRFVSDLSVTSDGFFGRYTSIPLGSQPSTVDSAASAGSTPVKTVESERPAIPARPTVPTITIRKPPPVKPTKRVTKPNQQRPRSQNPSCATACKRAGNIKTSFCSSEFVITGKVASLAPGPRGSLTINISLIKAYKSGGSTITQVGETMAVKSVSQCKRCPFLRRGNNYIIMGQVDEEGRGTLAPGAFTAIYKAVHHKLLMNINKQPC